MASPEATPDRRIHVLWRILVPLVGAIAVVIAIDLGLVLLEVTSTPIVELVRTGGRLLVVFVVLAPTARLLDRRRLREYGLARGRGWWIDLLFGAALGLAIFALSSGIGIAVGWIEVREVLSPAVQGGLWIALLVATLRLASVSLWEEVLFRGVLIRDASESLARRWPRTRAVLVATTISTSVFALIHVPQSVGAPEDSLLRMAVMWVTLGALLALPYLLTGQLAVSLGLHLTVNLALQHVFVVWEAQAAQAAAALHLEVVAPDPLAGTGGLLQILAIAVGYVAVLAWLRWRHGPLRIHPSLTAPPAVAAPDSAPATRDTAAGHSDGIAAGSDGADTAVVVTTGCDRTRRP